MVKQDHFILNGTWSDHQDNSATTSAIMTLALVITSIDLVLNNSTGKMGKRGRQWFDGRLATNVNMGW
jgi:hypothetical protein